MANGSMVDEFNEDELRAVNRTADGNVMVPLFDVFFDVAFGVLSRVPSEWQNIFAYSGVPADLQAWFGDLHGLLKRVDLLKDRSEGERAATLSG